MDTYRQSNASSPIRTAASPRPHNAPSPSKNILKSVESHVRVMSHLENVSISSSYTALRLRHPHDGRVAGEDNGNSASSSSGSSGSWSNPFLATRVHRGTPADVFYDEVVAPCVANSTSGQSYLFLVSGPVESGRSQTLYGSPHHSERGIIELTAADLVHRMKMRGNVLLASTPSGNASKTNVNGDGGVDEQRLGGLTVTYSAFVTRGTQITDTVTGSPVRVEEFPPPLGMVPLPWMRLLESAPNAVVVPEKKFADTSCVVQFHVYAPVDGSGRRSMATLTFVDVAAFRLPLCRDVQHLVETVRRVAGVSVEGGDPHFKDFMLTTLLESALVGYVTLVSITTISGRQDLYDASCAALRFSEDIRRIHQVLMLTHINSPRWLYDAAQSVDQLRGEREQLLLGHYMRGVYDYYRTAFRWLMKNVSDTDAGFNRLLEETESIRNHLEREVKLQCADLQMQIHNEDKACREEMEAARGAYDATAQQFEAVKRLDESIATLEQQISHNDLHYGHRISQMRIEISSLEAKSNSRQQEVHQLEKETKLYQSKTEEVISVVAKYGVDLSYYQSIYSAAREMEEITRKKRRYEEDLQLASQAAHRQTDTLREDRERRSQLSRLTVIQQRVDDLKRARASRISEREG